MDSNTMVNPGDRLFITCANKTYQIKDQYLPSIHFWDIHGRCYISHFITIDIPITLLFFMALFNFMIIYWLIFVFCFCFHVSNSKLSNQESIATCLLSFRLIINYCYGSSRLHHSTLLLNCIIKYYFIILCYHYLLSIIFIILSLFPFSPFKFHLILCYICCFISHCVSVFTIIFIIIIYLAKSLALKCWVKSNSFVLFLLDIYENMV